MKIEFTREQRITNALMLHSTSINDIGLLHGKIGIAIYFHHLVRQSGKSIFAEFADELIDQVTESLTVRLCQEWILLRAQKRFYKTLKNEH